MKIYTEITDELTGIKVIQFEEGETIGWIPTDPANSDYQAYLAYLAQLEEGDK
jgi:hypothetical protein